MLKQNFKTIFCYLLITGVLLPSFGLAQGIEAPKTLDEAKVFGLKILEQLPDTVKEVWQKEALPLWQKMWEWTRLTVRQVKPIIEPWWQKFFDLLRRKAEKEVQKELPKIKESLWQNFLKRFKDLLQDKTSSTPTPTPVPTPTLETQEVPVLVLKYFPLKDRKLDPEITGLGYELSIIRNKTEQFVFGLSQLLTRASIYHEYKNPDAMPSLKFKVFEEKEFLEALPTGLEIPWKKGQGIYRPDYRKILSDMNICNYVDNKGVKMVWLMGYHYGDIEPVESNMAMGKASRAFWNNGSYGDVSNSEETDDLPICDKTYVLYNLNYGREVSMEGFGHYIEAVFKFIDYDLFWNKFVGPYGEQAGDRRCGWMHYPPNGSVDYDWSNEKEVLSDCEDWEPDGSGEKKIVSCHTWYGKTCQVDSEGIMFQTWWAQNIPGKNNELIYNGKKMRNWWEFIGDFDSTIQKSKGFTY